MPKPYLTNHVGTLSAFIWLQQNIGWILAGRPYISYTAIGKIAPLLMTLSSAIPLCLPLCCGCVRGRARTDTSRCRRSLTKETLLDNVVSDDPILRLSLALSLKTIQSCVFCIGELHHTHFLGSITFGLCRFRKVSACARIQPYSKRVPVAASTSFSKLCGMLFVSVEACQFCYQVM